MRKQRGGGSGRERGRLLGRPARGRALSGTPRPADRVPGTAGEKFRREAARRTQRDDPRAHCKPVQGWAREPPRAEKNTEQVIRIHAAKPARSKCLREGTRLFPGHPPCSLCPLRLGTLRFAQEHRVSANFSCFYLSETQGLSFTIFPWVYAKFMFPATGPSASCG